MRLLIIFMVGLISGCATLNTTNDFEVLLNPALTAEGLQFSVKSNGCTQLSHFTIESQQQSYQIVRIKPDLCRAAPRWVKLNVKLISSASTVSFKNPLIFMENPQRRR